MTTLLEHKSEKHNEFLERIIRDNLIRSLEVYRDNHPNNVRYWREFMFTLDGIKDKVKKFDIIASPDLIVYSEGPANLIFLEAKYSWTPGSKVEMRRQLLGYHNYVADNPEFLIDFLKKNGIASEAIDVVTIGFSGVTPTKSGGLREQVYFTLFQEEQVVTDYYL